ncbi:STAS/SEC14 domain-containing protein [candidate division WOR-3 bacterium]|nr:STAS/SEC14 domain-containing protein [candidate division WOR-3 bacterium]
MVLKIVGNFTCEDATETLKKAEGLLGTNPGMNVLANFSRSPNLILDRETRRIIQKGAPKFEFQKVALIGVSPVTRMIAKVILVILGKVKESHFFETEEEAITWLKGTIEK